MERELGAFFPRRALLILASGKTRRLPSPGGPVGAVPQPDDPGATGQPHPFLSKPRRRRCAPGALGLRFGHAAVPPPPRFARVAWRRGRLGLRVLPVLRCVDEVALMGRWGGLPALRPVWAPGMGRPPRRCVGSLGQGAVAAGAPFAALRWSAGLGRRMGAVLRLGGAGAGRPAARIALVGPRPGVGLSAASLARPCGKPRNYRQIFWPAQAWGQFACVGVGVFGS